MGCRILYDKDAEYAALYCSTTERAFGPIFHDEGEGADAEAEGFMKWLKRDPRLLTESELSAAYSTWLVAREEFMNATEEV